MLGLGTWRPRLGLAALGLFALVAISGFVIPRVAFDDARANSYTRQVLKTEASHWSKVPAVRLQVIEAEPLVDPLEGASLDGRVVWRTIFGVPYGETEFEEGQAVQRWDFARARWTWGAFVLVEAGLLLTGAWLLFRDP